MKKKQLLIKNNSNWVKPFLVLAFIFLGSNANISLAQNWNQIIKSVASDRGVNDFFGYSVAISGEYAIVGAYLEDNDPTGGNFLENAGSAYILKNNAGTWSQVQKIVAADRGAFDYFGYSVAISGEYAIVGAYQEGHDTANGAFLGDAGSAYIFKNNAGTWSQVQKIVASDRGSLDYFGYSVAISGEYAIIGAWHEDHDRTGGNALSDAGSAYIFKNNAGTWSEVQKMVASDREAGDRFGYSVAISGEYAIVGAYAEDHDASGGNNLSNAGSAYIFKNNAGTWSQVQKLVASDREASDEFGVSVSISEEYAIVGAWGEDEDATGGNTAFGAGSAYIFKNNAGTWSQVQKIVASDRGVSDDFGYSVAISGEYAIVGANREDEDAKGENTLGNPGSAYIFKNNAGTWSQVQKIVASDRGAGDRFGYSVAISGDHMIVGASEEKEDAKGENTITGAGSVYIFKNSGTNGNSENTLGNSLTVFPNPTKGQLTIDFENTFSHLQLTVSNVLGQEVFQQDYVSGNKIDLNLEGAAGIYFIELVDGNNRARLKVTKE